MAKFEGSPRDEREDKTLAKTARTNMPTWERSKADQIHDRNGSATDRAKAKRMARLMANKRFRAEDV